jgi:hypothetical protein
LGELGNGEKEEKGKAFERRGRSHVKSNVKRSPIFEFIFIEIMANTINIVVY